MRLWSLVGCAALAGCGSRTGLAIPEELASDGSTTDAAIPDGAPADATSDTNLPDAGFDAPPDVRPDVIRADCPDADATLVYVVSMDHRLYSFYPPTASFQFIGTLDCPTSDGVFSMAVDRKGTAYVLYNNAATPTVGTLFRASTRTAACVALPQYQPDQQGFNVFGMGFATVGGGPAEKLYVLGAPDFSGSSGLATIDTTTLKLGFVGDNNPPLFGGELTGTGDGRLFSFYLYGSMQQPFIGEVDENTGHVKSETQLSGFGTVGAFAVAFWGGDFYVFTTPGGGGPSSVTRYRPADKSTVVVGSIGVTIVGAGVSTCAPQ